jgi:hypothetical protein
MPVDVSPYATLGQGNTGVNLLGPLAQISQIQNAQNQNALFQQTFRARQAMGPLAQQAIGPDGKMDWNKFSLLVSTHPETAFMAPEVLNQISQRKLVDAQTLGANLKNWEAKQQAIGSAAYSAAQSMTGDPSEPADAKHVVGAAANLLPETGPNGERLFDPKEVIGYLSGMGQFKTNGDLKAHLNQVAMASLRGSEMLGNIEYRPDAFHDANGNPFPGFVNKMAGGAQPSVNAGPTTQNTAQAAMAPGGMPPSAPGQQAPVQAAQPATPAGAPLTQTSPGPFRQKELGDVADYEKGLNSRTGDANQLLTLMGQARDYLRNFKPGGGTEFRAELAQMAQAAGLPQSTVDLVAKGSLDNVQAARKVLFGVGSQIAANLIHGAGGGRLTGNEWAQTLMKGSPNVDMSEGAIGKVMGSMRELAHYTQMEQEHFNGLKGIPGYDLTRAQHDWAQTYQRLIDARNAR